MRQLKYLIRLIIVIGSFIEMRLNI